MPTEQQIQTKRIKELEAQGYYVIKLINRVMSSKMFTQAPNEVRAAIA